MRRALASKVRRVLSHLALALLPKVPAPVSDEWEWRLEEGKAEALLQALLVSESPLALLAKWRAPDGCCDLPLPYPKLGSRRDGR